MVHIKLHYTLIKISKIEVLSTDSDNIPTVTTNEISEEILQMIEEHELTEQLDDVEPNHDVEPKEEAAFFVESRRGKTVLQYNDCRYRRAYETKQGTRWNCSVFKNCPGFVYINENNEIIMTNQDHIHDQATAAAAYYENTVEQKGKTFSMQKITNYDSIFSGPS